VTRTVSVVQVPVQADVTPTSANPATHTKVKVQTASVKDFIIFISIFVLLFFWFSSIAFTEFACHVIVLTMLKALILRFYSSSALLAMQTAVLARPLVSVSPSVHRSRSGIVSRRMKIRSCGFQHLLEQSL